MIKNNAKTIAILMATCNGEKYVEEMLRSLEKQTEDDFVCYIHDDGSTDQTMHILKKWVEDHPYHFMILEGQAQGSAKDNFFWCLRRWNPTTICSLIRMMYGCRTRSRKVSKR